MKDIRKKWNDRYELMQVPNQVIDVLELNLHLLPKQGKSLDLACGEGFCFNSISYTFIRYLSF